MQGVPKADLEMHLTSSEKLELQNIEQIHAWGCQPNMEPQWSHMEKGDYVMFYARGKFISVGELIFKKKSDDLALALWPQNKDTHQPWSCVFFVDNLHEIDLPLSDFKQITGYEFNMIRGFMPVKKGLNKIVEQFGSSENFINSITSGLSLSSLDELSTLASTNFNSSSLEEIAKFDELTRGKDEAKLEAALSNHSKNALGKKPEQIIQQVTTYKRNRKLVRDIKAKFDNKCQICGFTFKMANGQYYSEAAHIIAISTAKEGVDSPENIWVLCANHHRMLDTGAIKSVTKTQYLNSGIMHTLKSY
jgi:predicted HNH restriction endonuclease